MAVYHEILTWSSNKPTFIKDALRRIITNPLIHQNDIDELVWLLKKEKEGEIPLPLTPIPIDSSHIPTTISSINVFPKLISIKNPINICALHEQGHLQFSNKGLTVVYGNNGSGKSSYSKILKKFCWSRNRNFELKKNVFTLSTSQQQVDLVMEVNGSNTNYQWKEHLPPHAALNSIYVFDNDSADVYLNKENPTDYKPIGVDVLEKLVPLLNNISKNLDQEIALYNTQKPSLDRSLSNTDAGQWYAQLESKTRVEIDNYIQASQIDFNRKQELFALINSQNPQQKIQQLSNFKIRIGSYTQQFKKIEEKFNDQAIEQIKNLKSKYDDIKQAYDIATNELNSLNNIVGFGTNPWRTLWDAAKNFANSSGMSDGQNFPSNGSLNKCVLCQQELDELAQQRLLNFNQFILNDISTQLSTIQNEMQQKITIYSTLNIPLIENLIELSQYIVNFQNQCAEFTHSINLSKDIIVNYLQNKGTLNISHNIISSIINDLIPSIDIDLEQNNQLLRNKNALVAEYNELAAKEFLLNNKKTILQFYDEIKYKLWIKSCQAELNTTAISKKIGDLIENQAVSLQHKEFISHLSYFNQDLSSKVLISKTRTSQGNTFQKCSLNGITDSIDSVLSEGEKKIIAFSNFLAECTIDNRKNSIVLDDPVTSLDLDYREAIANKIIELSKDRQIIVLTHDLYFVRLLGDIHQKKLQQKYHLISIENYKGVSGIQSDEVPYLSKNINEMLESIKKILNEHDALILTNTHDRETKLDSARKRFRLLIERSVEEILSGKTYERFSKKIHFKKENLSSYIVTDQNDIDFLSSLFDRYSITEHDGGISTIAQLPSKQIIEQDVLNYINWKDSFKSKHKSFEYQTN
jgi:energy-coupling factor transporter ATP-binding protein EcfA2